MTLRDKVHELADNWMIPRLAALAVARLVAEECAKVCDDVPSGWYDDPVSEIAAAIRKEAEELK